MCLAIILVHGRIKPKCMEPWSYIHEATCLKICYLNKTISWNRCRNPTISFFTWRDKFESMQMCATLSPRFKRRSTEWSLPYMKQYIDRNNTSRDGFCTRCSFDAQGCCFDTKDLTREDVAEEEEGLWSSDFHSRSMRWSCSSRMARSEFLHSLLAFWSSEKTPCRSSTRSLASALKDFRAIQRDRHRHRQTDRQTDRAEQKP